MFSPDGETLLTVDFSGRGFLWNARDGGTLGELEGHRGPIWEAVFSNDGSLVATASFDGTACIWDTAGHLQWCTPDGRGRVVSVDLSPDGSQLDDGMASVWSIPA